MQPWLLGVRGPGRYVAPGEGGEGDPGSQEPPVVIDINGDVTIHGKIKPGSFGKIIVPLATIAAGRQYTFLAVADFSRLAMQGKLAMVGFGFKSGNDFHIAGLRGDGSTGTDEYIVHGTPPNGWNKLTGHTEVNEGDAAAGTQHTAYYQLITSSDGATYTLKTSTDGVTYTTVVQEQALTPFSNVSGVLTFGVALWFNNADAGPYTVTITQFADEEGISFPSEPFATDGATFPNYFAVHSPAFYDSGLDKTFVAWEAWAADGRAQHVTSLDHATGYFSDIEGMGRSLLVDNDHGNPVIMLDDEDYLHGFYGSHGDIAPPNMKHSVTRWADGGSGVGSHWSIEPEIAGEYSYPHPVMVGSTMYLFMRDDDTTTRRTLVVYPTTALANGVATWGSEVTLVDFGADTRFYMGPAFAVGSKIHFVATKSDGSDTIREHVYYFVYDTANGDLENHNASFSVASGDLPMDLSEANTNCRLFEHTGGNGGNTPYLAFDTNGDPFVAFLDGASSTYAVKVIKRTSGTWGSPVTVVSSGADNRHSAYAIGPLPAGEMEIFYEDDTGADWDRGGDIKRKVRSAAGTWGAAQTILTATDFALGQPNIVRDAHTDARVTFCEHRQASTDPATGELKVYLWGASGLVGYQQAPAASISSQADGVELREGGDAELREDGFDELREVAV